LIWLWICQWTKGVWGERTYLKNSQPLTGAMTSLQHVYEVRPRKDHRGVGLISDVLPFGRLWYGEPNAVSNAIGYAMHRSRSHDAVA
jgi:hypothetical protein